MTEKVSIHFEGIYCAYTHRKGRLPSSKKGAHVARPPKEGIISIHGSCELVERLTSSTPAPAYIYNPPLSTTILPALTSISNLYSATPTVFSRTLSTSSSDGIYFNAMTRSRSSKKHKDNEFKLKINSHRKHYRMMSTYEKINLRIVRVHSESDLVLSGITDETLVIR